MATEKQLEPETSGPLPVDEKASIAPQSPLATDVASGELHDVDPVWAKQVIRKIDKRIIVCCMITWTMNFIDKILLGQSAIFGIIQSTVGAHIRLTY